jgi:hypothetical protein
MRAKGVTRMLLFFTPRRINKLDTIKNYLFVLIVFAVAGTLGLLSLSHDDQQKSRLFNSESFIPRSHLLDDLIRKKYVLLEDDFTVKDSKKSLRQFPIGDFELLTNSHLNLHREVFFNGVESSSSISFISFFGSLNLRSPPLFS